MLELTVVLVVVTAITVAALSLANASTENVRVDKATMLVGDVITAMNQARTQHAGGAYYADYDGAPLDIYTLVDLGLLGLHYAPTAVDAPNPWDGSVGLFTDPSDPYIFVLALSNVPDLPTMNKLSARFGGNDDNCNSVSIVGIRCGFAWTTSTAGASADGYWWIHRFEVD